MAPKTSPFPCSPAPLGYTSYIISCPWVWSKPVMQWLYMAGVMGSWQCVKGLNPVDFELIKREIILCVSDLIRWLIALQEGPGLFWGDREVLPFPWRDKLPCCWKMPRKGVPLGTEDLSPATARNWVLPKLWRNLEEGTELLSHSPGIRWLWSCESLTRGFGLNVPGFLIHKLWED